MYSTRLTESEAIVGAIHAVSAAGTYNTGSIALGGARRFEFNVDLGTPTSATANFAVQYQAADGSTWTNITGAAIAQDSTGSKVHRVEVATELVQQLAYQGVTLIRGQLVITGTFPASVVCRSAETRFLPIANAAVVGQVVNAVA